MKVRIVSIPNKNNNAAKWHACGGKFYPDGGPIDGWDPTLRKRYPVLEELYNKDITSPEAAAYTAAKLKWDRDHPGEPYPQYFHQRLDAYIKEKKMEADAKAIERAEKIHGALSNGVSRVGDWLYDTYNRITNRACGGKLYPDGGPIDPPWASFVPSQPREPQVVRPQQQVNPYLLGLSAGMGQNEAAKYSTTAQTPEFQQGYYDGQTQVVASEAAKAGRAPIVEPGIEVVSPVLSVLPGTGDVKDFADIADYYYNTGDLATSLGLAALTAASPVQGVGKLGKLSNEARTLNYKIAKGEVSLRPKKKVAKKVKNAVDGHRPNLSYLEETSGIVFPDKQIHPIFDDLENRFPREARKTRVNVSDIDMSYMTDRQKEAAKQMVRGRTRGKKWTNEHRENPFRGKSAEEQVEMLGREFENMSSNATNTSNAAPTSEAKPKNQKTPWKEKTRKEKLKSVAKKAGWTLGPVGVISGGIGLWNLNEKKKENNNEYTKYKTDKEAVNDQTSYQDSVMRDYYDNFTGDSIYQPNVDSYNQYRDAVPDSLRSKLEDIILKDSLEKIQMAEDVDWKWYGKKTPKKR